MGHRLVEVIHVWQSNSYGLSIVQCRVSHHLLPVASSNDLGMVLRHWWQVNSDLYDVIRGNLSVQSLSKVYGHQQSLLVSKSLNKRQIEIFITNSPFLSVEWTNNGCTHKYPHSQCIIGEDRVTYTNINKYKHKRKVKGYHKQVSAELPHWTAGLVKFGMRLYVHIAKLRPKVSKSDFQGSHIT